MAIELTVRDHVLSIIDDEFLEIWFATTQIGVTLAAPGNDVTGR
jgi:hypothetical protein